MEGLALAVLLGVSGGLLYTKKVSKDKRRAREGFAEIMNPEVAKAFNPIHNEYVQTGASRFNPIQNLMDPNNNVLLPPDFSPEDVRKVQKNLRNATGGAIAKPNDPSFQLERDPRKNILLNAGGKGTAMAAIKTCEAIKSIDCNAFDKEDFAFNCGVCFQDGKTASGNPTVGGLYITEDDRASAEAIAKRMNSRSVNYQPSTGKCADNMFVSTKEQCIALKKKLDCQTNQSFDTEDCSQCFQDQSFHYTSKELVKTPPMLVLTGSGKVAINKVGSNDTNLTGTLTDQAQQFEIPDFAEGDILQIGVTPASGSVAGYLVGVTPSGEFRMDIIRLIQTDITTGAKPRLAGVKQVGDDVYTLIKPGRGKSEMKLALLNTFTFLEVTEQEAIACGSAPYISKESSATFLESSPCFKKGQKPGSYSLDCLQRTFVDAGCTEAGEAYPSTQSKAQALMTGPDGKLLTIGQIAGIIYEKSTTAYTGLRENGSKLPVLEWDKVSRFCTGKSITSPCDFDNKEGGPLSAECLSYLWKNTGAVENVPGNVGSTYSSSSKQASLNAMNNDRFCTPKGTMAPIDANGKVNEAAVAAAQAKGGVKAVQEFYNQIHLKANDNTQSDDARKDALQQCYGVEFQKVESQTSNDKVTLSGGGCVPQMMVDTVTNPKYGQFSKDVNVQNDWVVSFTVNFSNVKQGEFWKLIFKITRKGSDDYIAMGVMNANETLATGNNGRMRLWYWSAGQWVAIFDTPNIVWNQDINVTLTHKANLTVMKLTGGMTWENKAQDSAKPWTGPATFYVNGASTEQLPQLQATIKNMSWNSCENAYPSVLDFKPGRTKSGMNKPPGRKYVKITGIDYPYNDIKFNPNQPWEECAEECDTTPGCVGYALYKENRRGCWYKSRLENSTRNGNRDTFKAVSEGGKNYTDPPNWDQYSCPVKVLGNFGMAPWGNQWGARDIGGFPDDGTAKWIWYTANAQDNAPAGRWFPFYYKYTNPTNDTIPAKMWIISDDASWVSFNDTVLASQINAAGILEFEIPPGESSLHINAINGGGPAGLIVICKDTRTNKTVFVSNGDWVTDNSACSRR